MNALLRQNVFDGFEVREIKLNTLVRYTISGEINQAFLSEEEKQEDKGDYILWQDLKETLFFLVKGRKLPTLFHLTFAFPKEKITEIPTDQVESFLINIHFEENRLQLISATSMKSFTMDRSMERYWDGFLPQWLRQNGINAESE